MAQMRHWWSQARTSQQFESLALFIDRAELPRNDERGSRDRRKPASGPIDAMRGRDLGPTNPHAHDAQAHQKKIKNRDEKVLRGFVCWRFYCGACLHSLSLNLDKPGIRRHQFEVAI
jgi:hypothetical protein